MESKSILFGSPLKDYPAVLKQSQKYPFIRTKYWWNNYTPFRLPPETFDGRDVWKAYTQFPDNQKCQDSWSIVATDVLADRYTILSVAQINLFLSSEEIVACIAKPPLPRLPGVISFSPNEVSVSNENVNNNNTNNACQGYSIYDAWEYIYEFGVPETSCFSEIKLNKILPLPKKLTYPEKEKVYQGYCDKVRCIGEIDGKPVARRTFYLNGIFNIYETTLNGSFDLPKTVETIKYELMRFGPVAAGFIIYENFINDYDGKTIYKNVSGKPLGGHYVSIMGWGKDQTTGDEYWICRNSFGTLWGRLGFFYMKIGIPECHLEENISGCDPYFHKLELNQFVSYDTEIDGKRVNFNDMSLFNPELARRRNLFEIDEETFYPVKTLELIKKGKLYGSLQPLIQYRKNLPNRNYYWAEDFSKFKFVTEVEVDKNKQSITINYNYVWYIVFCILFIFIGYKNR